MENPMYNPQLNTFLQAADSGSFIKAAEVLYISPTAVTKQINSLEAGLNLKLFNRTHRGLTLTSAGESLYRDAKALIQYAEDSLARAKAATREDDTIIRIGTSPMTSSRILINLWPKVRVFCPDFKFRLVPFENTHQVHAAVLKSMGEKIDIVAGIFSNNILELEQCDVLPLFRDPVCCAVPIHHPLAEKKSLRVEDLYGENLMMIKWGQIRQMDELRQELTHHHPQIQIVDFDFYNLEIFNQCETENRLLVSVKSWQQVHPLLKILPVEWDYVIPFGFIYASSPSQKVRSFIQGVSQAFRSNEELPMIPL